MTTAKPAQERASMPALKVSDIMTRQVRTAKPSDRLADIHSLMRLSGFRHLPVVDDDDGLVGVVSDRDVHLAWTQGPDTRVATFMSRSTEFVFGHMPARAAAAAMLHRKIGCLPVLDNQRHVVGIVTESDFLAIACRALTIQEALAKQS